MLSPSLPVILSLSINSGQAPARSAEVEGRSGQAPPRSGEIEARGRILNLMPLPFQG
jgi:hypothetical protein